MKSHTFSTQTPTNHHKCRCSAAWIFLLVALPCISAFAQNAWTGLGGTTNWTTPGNWIYGSIPDSYQTVQFDNDPTHPVVAAGVVDNIVDAPFTISAFQYTT